MKRSIDETITKNFLILKQIVIDSVSVASTLSKSVPTSLFVSCMLYLIKKYIYHILAKIAENPDYFKSTLDQINATLNNFESGSETLSNIVKK